MQHELEVLNGQVEAAESELRRDRVRDEYALMDKKVIQAAVFTVARTSLHSAGAAITCS
jgi:hypothetical protein